jgi:class 3 adenylate cyclase
VISAVLTIRRPPQSGLSRLVIAHGANCSRHSVQKFGTAVHIGARVTALAAPGEVLVSQTVRDLVAGLGLTFAERGVHTLKGAPSEWRLFQAIVD